MRWTHPKYVVLWALLLPLLTWGCQGTMGYTGKVAPADKRVMMQSSEPSTGTWEGRDLTIDYRANPQGGFLKIEADVDLDDYLSQYDVLRYFYLSLHFVDEQGVILGYHPIYSTQNHRMDMDIVAKTSVPLPAGTAGLVFSYKGYAMHVGGGNGNGHVTFWQTPRG